MRIFPCASGYLRRAVRCLCHNRPLQIFTYSESRPSRQRSIVSSRKCRNCLCLVAGLQCFDFSVLCIVFLFYSQVGSTPQIPSSGEPPCRLWLQGSPPSTSCAKVISFNSIDKFIAFLCHFGITDRAYRIVNWRCWDADSVITDFREGTRIHELLENSSFLQVFHELPRNLAELVCFVPGL